MSGGLIYQRPRSGEEYIGRTGTNSRVAFEFPTISTSAYTANDQIGDVMEFTNCAGIDNGTGIITDAVLTDNDNQSANVELWLFSEDPTTSDAGDNNAFNPSEADLEKLVARIVFDTYFTGNGNSISQVEVDSAGYQCTGNQTSLFGIAVIREAKTYNAANDLSFKIKMTRDHDGPPPAAVGSDVLWYYKMSNTSWLDSGPNGLDLTAVNSPTVTPGIVGNAVSIDRSSSQELQHSDDTNFRFTDTTSVVFWYRQTLTPVSNITPISKLNDWGVDWVGSHFSFRVFDGGIQTVTATSVTNAINTNYFFFLYYIPNSEIGIQINNGTIHTLSVGTVVNANTTFTIGSFGGSNFIDGWIDAVGAWRRKLTPIEVSNLYNGGAGRELF